MLVSRKATFFQRRFNNVTRVQYVLDVDYAAFKSSIARPDRKISVAFPLLAESGLFGSTMGLLNELALEGCSADQVSVPFLNRATGWSTHTVPPVRTIPDSDDVPCSVPARAFLRGPVPNGVPDAVIGKDPLQLRRAPDPVKKGQTGSSVHAVISRPPRSKTSKPPVLDGLNPFRSVQALGEQRSGAGGMRATASLERQSLVQMN